MMTRFRDWVRGYSEEDIDSALKRIDEHYMHPGCIIPMSGREMKALIGERMMDLFWMVRDTEFLQRRPKPPAAESEEK